jgi:hypothetical protein
MKLPKHEEIRVMLQGGLGNQLFQFFAGLYASEIYNKHLILDLSLMSIRHSEYSPQRLFELGRLDFLPPYKVRSLKSDYYKVRVAKKFEFISGLFQIATNLEEIEKRKNITILNGFFQEKYEWIMNKERIINYLCLNRQQSEVANSIRRKFSSEVSVGIHLRLGDYLKLQEFPPIKQTFLTKVMEELVNELGYLPQCYLITDSPAEAKQMFSSSFQDYSVRVINSSDLSPIEIIHVLSDFRFLVLSKSSLSWWSGYLADHKQKTVFAPLTCNPEVRGAFQRKQVLHGWRLILNEEG